AGLELQVQAREHGTIPARVGEAHLLEANGHPGALARLAGAAHPVARARGGGLQGLELAEGGDGLGELELTIAELREEAGAGEGADQGDDLAGPDPAAH